MNEESINDVSLVSNYEPQKKKRKTRAERREALQEKKEKILAFRKQIILFLSFANFKRKKTL